MTTLAWIRADDPPDAFPPLDTALTHPDGLLAAGGDLSPSRLLAAYRRGIFPWYEAGQPVLWWSPDPRTVILPGELHVSRSLRRRLRRSGFDYAFDEDFAAVIRACSEPRAGQPGTWITDEMIAAFERLHELGSAHCVSVFDGERLVGGVYGVVIGRVVFGESMFSRVSDASKIALVALCRWMIETGRALLDCQVLSPHLLTLGARTVPRRQFVDMLGTLTGRNVQPVTMPAGRTAVLSLAAPPQ